MLKRSRLVSVAVFALSIQLLNHFIGAPAHANKTVAYTLTFPFERTFTEESRFKPPMKFSASDIRSLLSNQCLVYIGEKPQVRVGTASGKLASMTSVRPGHKLTSATWIKDDDGENVFRFRGVCVFVSKISLNLPASNFYTFRVSAKNPYINNGESYPYTLAQLKSMKEGIRESLRGTGNALGSFTPVPDLETPKVQILGCIEGRLVMDLESQEVEGGEKISTAYFAVTNSVYKRKQPGWNYPEFQQLDQRPENTTRDISDDEDEDIALPQQVSEDTRVFSNWRKVEEKNFTVNLRATYSRWGQTGREIVKEKEFTVEIDNDCKSATVTSR